MTFAKAAVICAALVNYLIVKTVEEEGNCWLDAIQNVPARRELTQGISQAGKFPTTAAFRMDENFPDDTRLTDSLVNASQLLVVSSRFRQALEEIPGALVGNEILPVAIINHKGVREPSPYFVVHQVGHPACLDEQRSVGGRSRSNPGKYEFLDKMVLDESKIDPDRMLFRAAQFPDVPLMRRDLAAKLAAKKLDGIELCEIDGYF